MEFLFITEQIFEEAATVWLVWDGAKPSSSKENIFKIALLLLSSFFVNSISATKCICMQSHHSFKHLSLISIISLPISIVVIGYNFYLYCSLHIDVVYYIIVKICSKWLGMGILLRG